MGADPIARRICLGDNDSIQMNWANGQLRSPIVSDTPWMTMFHSWNNGNGYSSPCTVQWNMRQYVTADACFTLDIPEITKQSSIKLYPNPVVHNEEIILESEKEIESIEVFNLLGRKVLTSKSSIFKVTLPGTYVLGMQFSDGTTKALRFIVN